MRLERVVSSGDAGVGWGWRWVGERVARAKVKYSMEAGLLASQAASEIHGLEHRQHPG